MPMTAAMVVGMGTVVSSAFEDEAIAAIGFLTRLLIRSTKDCVRGL